MPRYLHEFPQSEDHLRDKWQQTLRQLRLVVPMMIVSSIMTIGIFAFSAGLFSPDQETDPQAPQIYAIVFAAIGMSFGFTFWMFNRSKRYVQECLQRIETRDIELTSFSGEVVKVIDMGSSNPYLTMLCRNDEDGKQRYIYIPRNALTPLGFEVGKGSAGTRLRAEIFKPKLKLVMFMHMMPAIVVNDQELQSFA